MMAYTPIPSKYLKSKYQSNVTTPSFIKPQASTGMSIATNKSTTGNKINFSSFKGSFGGGSSGGGANIPAPVNLPMSTPETPSPGALPYSGWMAKQNDIIAKQNAYIDAMQAGGSGDGGYRLSDAELFNQQLENAYLMKSLGYNVDFQDGQMVYSKSEQDYLTPYGEYGYGGSQGAVYESDWLAANQQLQYPPEQFTYPPSSSAGNYDSYYQDYQPQYSRNGYYDQYYSNYAQRYYGNGYNGYSRGDGYNRYNNYNRYQKYNRYKSNRYNGYNRNNNSYNRYRWYGQGR